MMKPFVIFVSLVAFIDAVAAVYDYEIRWSVTKNHGIQQTGARGTINLPDDFLPERYTENLGALRITREHFCAQVCKYVFRTSDGTVTSATIKRYLHRHSANCAQETVIKCPANPTPVYIAIIGNQYTIHVPMIENDPLEGKTLPSAPQF